ncbi:diguanylate cyclase domain-containing protein [Pararhodospirillum photometricum]|nr:diguanylate cyclase [Pararhodospirillum photometricum]
MRGPLPLVLALVSLFVLCLLGPLQAAQPVERVVLHLKWTHAFQFAGYYAAQSLGYYREAGLDVDIREALPGTDVVQAVVADEGHYGIGTSSLLLARHAGHPVVALAVIFQHSPLVLVARSLFPGQTLHDLVGRRVMLEPQSEELLASLQKEGIAPGTLTLLDHSFDPQDLMEGMVDAMSAYTTNELYYFERAGFPYLLFSPRTQGIDFYGDTLFTSEQEIDRHPARVRAFRAASLKGWQYALSHPAQVIDMILARAPDSHERAFYEYEAHQTAPLIRPDLVEIGYMSPARWRHIADTYAEIGLLPPGLPLGGFLYNATPPNGLSGAWPTYSLGGAGLLALLVGTSLLRSRHRRHVARLNAELRDVHAALDESEGRFKVLSETTSVGLFVVRDGRLILVNPVLTTLTGFSREELLRMDPYTLVHPDDRGLVQARSQARGRGDPTPNRYEIRLLHANGSERWVELTAGQLSYGGSMATIGSLTDLTERRRTEERIRHMAQHDPLTGLPNRAQVSDRLHQALPRPGGEGPPLALLYIDLDRFKPINGTHGHAVGDRVLQEVGRRLRAVLRRSDLAGRIGGDEFVVLVLPGGDRAELRELCQRLRATIARPIEINGLTVSVTASVGIALCPEHGQDEVTLARAADLALYEAKRQGRDTERFYHPGIVRDLADIH